MKSTVIAPASGNMDALFVGIREFPTEKIVMLAASKYVDDAKKAKKSLEKFKIPAEIIHLDGELWESTFDAIASISVAKGKDVMVNIGTGDSTTRCAATSAAFVNGLKTFDVMKDEVMMLPVLKFSYYKMISEKKMSILGLLYRDKGCCASFEEISKRLGMSLPLVSYHINGNIKSEGLKQMGLIDTLQNKSRINVSLSPMGRLLTKGYVSCDQKK